MSIYFILPYLGRELQEKALAKLILLNPFKYSLFSSDDITKILNYNESMNNRYGGVIWTNHALERLRELQITQSDAWYSFQHPDGQMPGSTAGSTKYYKNYGAQRIEVVATRNEKKEWIILSRWSKLVGTGQPIFKREGNLFIIILRKLLRI